MRIALTIRKHRIAPLFETARRVRVVSGKRVEEMPLPGPTPVERVAQVVRTGADLLVTGGIGRTFRFMFENVGTGVLAWVVGPADEVVQRILEQADRRRKIAVPSADAKPDAEIEPCFGRAPWFVLFDPATGVFEFLPNATPGGGAASRLLDLGVGTVLTDRIGPNSAGTLGAGGAQVVTVRAGTAEEAIAAFESGMQSPVLLATAGAGADLTVCPAPAPRTRRTKR